MAYTTINKSSDYFNTKLYTGNGGTQALTGVGFQPDWTWFKSRSGTNNHVLFDIVRGVTKGIYSDLTNAEDTLANSLSSFDSDGFTLGADTGSGGSVNGNTNSMASWNWKANGAGSANTAGSINSTVSVSATSGFSIVSYTGNGTGNSTIGHGLGATPKFIIVKRRSASSAWGTYSPSFVSASEPRIVYLNQTGSYANDTNVWGTSAAFNNNTFTVGDWAGSNASGQTFIAYCFAEKQGYSKFGSYVGNGNANGTFVYTGFKPAFVIVKRTNGNENWTMHDNKRSSSNGFNPVDKTLHPNRNYSVSTGTARGMDLLSNGFKFTGTDEGNISGGSYIYMAFAEAPLVGTNNVPCTAR